MQLADRLPRIAQLRDATVTHLLVGGLVCFFVLSPALFTPWAFGLDYTNHIWLVWQQSLAISHSGHPTLYLQTPQGIFEPFYGFYGGTLYAVAGGLSALVGNHAYPVFVASIGAITGFAYGGMWWLGRQLGLSRWVAHLPAFIFVTGAYFITDAYARGAWPELVAFGAVPMFVAGAVRLLAGPWRAWPAILFVVATVALTGSHNLTLFWSVLVLGAVAVAALIAAGRSRPSPRQLAAVAALALAAVGINSWFLLLDLVHSKDVQAWVQNAGFLEKPFFEYLYFDNIGNVLDPLRGFPSQSTTYGLVIAPPVFAFGFAVVLGALAWPRLGEAGRTLRALWLILLAAMAVIVFMLVMPGSWWVSLGAPFSNIQYPYRLAAWLLVGVAAQLAISLRFARRLGGARRDVAVVLAIALVLATAVQATAQMYAGPRVDKMINGAITPRTWAFANGPRIQPATFYDPYSYADASLPVVETPESRKIDLPEPAAGDTRLEADVKLPRGRGPIATNIAAGPYVVRVEGLPVVGRTPAGMMVVKPPPGGARRAHLVVVADAGGLEAAGVVISVLCLLGCAGLIVFLAVRRRLGYRRQPDPAILA